jgi:tetratricopeptide (TPR) repeat protein
MLQTKSFFLFFGLVMLMGCSPETIFMRPGLDTPSQHVTNGQQLLRRGKVDDACREFARAKELDPQFPLAYVGLGIALGRKGDLENGLKNLDHARRLADSAEERAAVQKGYDQFYEIVHANPIPRPAQ